MIESEEETAVIQHSMSTTENSVKNDVLDSYMTSGYLTKFELCKILSLRACQLCEDDEFAHSRAKKRDTRSDMQIALDEIKSGTLVASVRRYLPNEGTYEDRPLSSLIVLDELIDECVTSYDAL